MRWPSLRFMSLLAASLLLVLGFAQSLLSYAALCLTPEAKPNAPYDYLLALCDALSWMKSGRDRLVSAQGGDDLLSQATEFMLAVKLANGDYECAVRRLQAYKESQQKAVKASADAASAVLVMLQKHNEQVLALYKDTVDGKFDNQGLGTVAEKIASLGAQADDVWKMLPMAAVMATYSIVDPADPSTGRLARLTLTSKERSEILERLRSSFGSTVVEGMKAGQLPLEATAGALYGFLNDKQWKSSDAP